jgi:hypothetical protein
MHKSIIIFLGLLTFLIPVAPSISNSNALAFSDYGYQADQYENYANDMANNNYYKSQGSDVVKKIKCNNINSNLNGVEANIGTGDSLGLEAASLQDDASSNWLGNGQANNGNFDLDCINNNNNEGGQGGGATGPQGPEGPEGPQGLPGITQLNDANTYQVTSEEIVNTFTSSTSGAASCNSGDFVINGGFTITGTSPSPAGVTLLENTNKPFYTPFISGWEVFIFPTTSPGTVIYLVHATCFDNSPSTSLAAASSAVSTLQQQSEDSPIISQAIVDSPKLAALEKQPEDSSELTATEKITKLKQQWLDLLP